MVCWNAESGKDENGRCVSWPCYVAANEGGRPTAATSCGPRARARATSFVICFYQIMTRKQPYEDVESQEVEARYARNEFPPVAGILFGDIIQRCWMCKFGSAVEVRNHLGL